MNKTRFGLSENTEGALAYVFGIISGLVFLIVENDNRFIRFHSLQSIMFFVCMVVLNILVSVIFFVPFFGFFEFIVRLASFIAYITLIILAHRGKVVRIPFIGELAWKLSF